MTKRLKLHLFHLAAGLIIYGLLAISVSQAGTQFDDDDDVLLEEDNTAIETPLSEIETEGSVVDKLLDPAKFTLGYTFSHGTDTPDKIIDNQLFLRLEYGSLVSDNLFFKLDARTSVHLKNDHIAEAKNDDLTIRGRIRELYIQPGFDNLTLTFGKQIHVWGKADTAAITDVLSPRDLSQFIFVDLEDARQGQWMASANVYAPLFNTFVFISPYPGRDREPDDATRYQRPLPGENNFTIQKNDLQFGDLEWGIKLDRTILKTDISLMAGRFFSNAARVHFTGRFENGKPLLEKTWPDFYMAGAAAAHAWQNFLFKLELAVKNDFPIQGLNPQNMFLILDKDLIDAAAGIEYDANSKYKITLELSNRYILSGISGLTPGTDENSSALYATFFKDFLNQTLEFEYIFYHHLQEKSRFHKFRLIYDLTDHIQLMGEYATFHVTDTDSLMYPYRREDRIGFEIRYFF